jgi:hypothetical protein
MLGSHAKSCVLIRSMLHTLLAIISSDWDTAEIRQSVVCAYPDAFIFDIHLNAERAS